MKLIVCLKGVDYTSKTTWEIQQFGTEHRLLESGKQKRRAILHCEISYQLQLKHFGT